MHSHGLGEQPRHLGPRGRPCHGGVARGLRVVQKAAVPGTQKISKFVPRRGRPDAKQVLAIERTILTTARRMFLEEGYDAVAMEGIALAAGVSKGTLYARHPSKSALFRAIVTDSVAQWSADAAVDDHLLTDDIGERLRHHGRVTARYMLNSELQAFQRILLAARYRFPELSRPIYETGYLYFVTLIADDIVAAARRDGIAVRDPGSIARHLISTISGWYGQESAVHDVTLEDIAAVSDRTVDLLMAARPSW